MLLALGMIFRVRTYVFDRCRRGIRSGVKQLNTPRVPHSACQCYLVRSYTLHHIVCIDRLERGPLWGNRVFRCNHSNVTLRRRSFLLFQASVCI